MKVLLMTDYNAPYGGNFIESLKEMNKKMNNDNNHLFYLINDRAMDKQWVNEIEEVCCKKVDFYNKENIRNIYAKICIAVQKYDIDAIYCHFCRPKTQIAIKLYTLLHRKLKLISHFHNHCKHSKNIFTNIFYRMAYQFYKGNLNIGCSKSVMESMPYKKNICTYVDNAINFNRLDKYRIMDVRDNNKEYLVLMFGFDYYRKGIDIAIDAIKKMKNVRLAISLAANRESVEEIIMAKEGRIPQFVSFLDPIDDIATYYRMSDVFLSAAREEGFCYSIVEAAYCGTQIITSDIPGVPKEIPGEIIFKSENWMDLKQKIEYSMKNICDENAKGYVIDKYGIESWTNRIIDNIKMVLGE